MARGWHIAVCPLWPLDPPRLGGRVQGRMSKPRLQTLALGRGGMSGCFCAMSEHPASLPLVPLTVPVPEALSVPQALGCWDPFLEPTGASLFSWAEARAQPGFGGRGWKEMDKCCGSEFLELSELNRNLHWLFPIALSL